MSKTILAKIISRRHENNFTQEYMASRLNITQSYYHKIENGKKTLSLERTIKIAAILDLPITDLFGPHNSGQSA